MADNQEALSASALPHEKARAMYTRLESLRWVVLERARDCSYVTLPSLIPSQWINDWTEIPEPFQSLGARGVNNLSSKLMLALFPPGQPWFRLRVKSQVKAELGDRLSDIESKLADIELTLHNLLEMGHYRPLLSEMLKHLMVGGTALLHVPEKDKPRFFRLDQHCIVRDGMDRPLRTLIREVTIASAIPDDVAAACSVSKKDPIHKVEIYTSVHWHHDTDRVRWHQEINDIEVPNSHGDVPCDRSPWVPLRWIAVPGRDYGRGQVEEYLGDLRSLEELSECIVQFAAAASKIVALVHPNATTSVAALNKAESGDAIVGSKADIDILQLEKQQDFQVVIQTVERLQTALSYAFLLQTGTTRNAERVTAEEIRAQAQELEDALGGVYTVLAQELQLPLAKRLLQIAMKTGQVPQLPADALDLVVVTGFEALGRNHSANRLNQLLQNMSQLVTPQVLAQKLDFDELFARLGAAYGVEKPGDLLKSASDVQAEQQQSTMQQALIRAAPQMAGPLAQHAVAQAGGGGGSQEQS